MQRAFRLLFVALSVCSTAVSLSFSDYLSHAFGDEAVLHHLSLSALDATPLRHEAEVSGAAVFACCSFEEADCASVVTSLQTPVQPIYTSTSFACYVIPAIDASTAIPDGMLVWRSLPVSLKISPSLSQHVALHQETHGITSKHSLTEDYSGQMLEISFYPAATDGDAVASSSSVSATIKHLLAGRAAGVKSAVEAITQYAPAATNHWNDILRNVSPVSIASSDADFYTSCRYEDLIFTEDSFSITIDNLNALFRPSAPSSCLSALIAVTASLSKVAAVTLEPKYAPANDFVSRYVQVGSSASIPLYHSVGLVGNNVRIGVADTGVDELSCFFVNDDKSFVTRSTAATPVTDASKRVIIQYVAFMDEADHPDGHGTHVCGTIAGSTSNSGYTQYGGVSPGAKIAFYDVGVAGDPYLYIPSLQSYVFPAAASAGATLHSNSWGGGINSYNSFCVQADTYLYNNVNFLALFAAGNSGSGASTVINPAIAKNVVSVGASGSGHGSGINNLAYFSSRGPTFDARFGVDVLAQGYGTYSARSSADTTSETCQYLSMSGTSMATPAVAAAAALVTQYFSDATYFASVCRSGYPNCGSAFQPSGSLVKTVLLHSGQHIGGSYAYPGNEQGFGRVMLSNVLVQSGITTAGMDLYVNDVTIASGGQISLAVDVTSSSIPLKVTISWMDPPNVVSAAKQLLNDIDLRVVSPSNTIYYGNNNANVDSVNNAEMVMISSPSAGVYTVSIEAKSFPSTANQKVSIVITSIGTVFPATSPPTSNPTLKPTMEPTVSFRPTPEPTAKPTTASPTFKPSIPPPTLKPTGVPTIKPTGRPSESPTFRPTGTPTLRPTGHPSVSPTFRPSGTPTLMPTGRPSVSPTFRPSAVPTLVPTPKPTTLRPSGRPSESPTFRPSAIPTVRPTGKPSVSPTFRPSGIPTLKPTGHPSVSPTFRPSGVPTLIPTGRPSVSPTFRPSGIPTLRPTGRPSVSPTFRPSGIPTLKPTGRPSVSPTFRPSGIPTLKPTGRPSVSPTLRPTLRPTLKPVTRVPTLRPDVASVNILENDANDNEVANAAE